MKPTAHRGNRAAFADYLRNAMKAKYGPKYKAAQLAADSGISDQTISRWLRLAADPTHEKLKQLAPVLDVSVNELLAVAEIIPTDGGDLGAKPDPAGAMVRMLHDEARDIDDPERLADIEENLRHQIRIAEDYMRLSIELLRREAAAGDARGTDDASAS